MCGKVSKESAWEKFESRDQLVYIQSTTIADITKSVMEEQGCFLKVTEIVCEIFGILG